MPFDAGGVCAGAAERASEPSARAGRQRLFLDTPVTYLKGVGPARAEALRRLGIITAGDLLFHVPHRYEDASTVAPIKSLEPGMHGTVIGTVISKGVIPTRKGLRIFQAVLRDETGMIEVSWPGQPFLDRTIDKGDVLLVTGNVRFFHGRQLQPREFVNLGDDEQRRPRRDACCRSIRRPKGCRSSSFARSSTRISTRCSPLVTEYLPADVLATAGRAGHRRRAAHGAPAVVDRRGDARAGRGSRSRSCSSSSCCISAPRSWRASAAPASVRRTSAS